MWRMLNGIAWNSTIQHWRDYVHTWNLMSPVMLDWENDLLERAQVALLEIASTLTYSLVEDKLSFTIYNPISYYVVYYYCQSKSSISS